MRLRCYLAMADSGWFSAGCGHVAPIGIRAAVRWMGPAATVRQLGLRLWCSRCGNRRVSIVLQPDTRPAWLREREGPRPETRAGLPA